MPPPPPVPRIVLRRPTTTTEEPRRAPGTGYASSSGRNSSGYSSPSRYTSGHASSSHTDSPPPTVQTRTNHTSLAPTNPPHGIRTFSSSTAAPGPLSSASGITVGTSPFEYTAVPTAATASCLTWIKLKHGAPMSPVELAIMNNLTVVMARLDDLKALVESVVKQGEEGDEEEKGGRG